MNFISRKIHSIHLDYQQKQVSRLYESEGLTDRVLEKQIEINKKRHELNLPDKHEMLYKRFVQ